MFVSFVRVRTFTDIAECGRIADACSRASVSVLSRSEHAGGEFG